jgi:hypothetical protein
VRFDPFEVTKTVVDDLLPNERLEYQYNMLAFMQQFGVGVLDGQSGGRAFYGDPIEITGRSNFQIHNLTGAGAGRCAQRIRAAGLKPNREAHSSAHAARRNSALITSHGTPILPSEVLST